MGYSGGKTCETKEPLTCSIQHYLQVNRIRIELLDSVGKNTLDHPSVALSSGPPYFAYAVPFIGIPATPPVITKDYQSQLCPSFKIKFNHLPLHEASQLPFSLTSSRISPSHTPDPAVYACLPICLGAAPGQVTHVIHLATPCSAWSRAYNRGLVFVE